MVKQPLIFLVLFTWFLECKNKPIKITKPINDTAEIINLAIRTAFYHENLPEISSLYLGNLFNDSILVQTDSLPIRLFPTGLDSMKFKYLNENQITRLRHSYNISEFPNYLYICCLEKSDTSYYISVQSRSCAPFGGGGSIEINIGKRQDSLFVIHHSSNSIN